jgi:hypothetical protein
MRETKTVDVSSLCSNVLACNIFVCLLYLSGHELVMLEYGSGSSTFLFSLYAHRYVSIELSMDYCHLFENMVRSLPYRSVVISYMNRQGAQFVETYRYEQNRADQNQSFPIHVYCLSPDLNSSSTRSFRRRRRSRYSMYRNYVNFVSEYLSNLTFDFVLVDGRARPQVAYAILKQLNTLDGKVFVHDWNSRRGYHVITREFYDIIDQQVQSDQPGGGGLVVLKRKPDVIGLDKMHEIHWRFGRKPSWWL